MMVRSYFKRDTLYFSRQTEGGWPVERFIRTKEGTITIMRVLMRLPEAKTYPLIDPDGPVTHGTGFWQRLGFDGFSLRDQTIKLTRIQLPLWLFVLLGAIAPFLWLVTRWRASRELRRREGFPVVQDSRAEQLTG